MLTDFEHILLLPWFPEKNSEPVQKAGIGSVELYRLMEFKHFSYSEFQNTQKNSVKYFTKILTNIPQTINVTKFV